MSLFFQAKPVSWTMLNTGNGNDSNPDSGWIIINGNYWWQTGGYGPAYTAGRNLAARFKPNAGPSFFGLMTSGAPYTGDVIEFAFHTIQSTTRWWIYELGVQKYDTGINNSSNNVCEIRVFQDGTVEYYIDGALVYTSLRDKAEVRAMSLRAGISAGYYSSWDAAHETQPAVPAQSPMLSQSDIAEVGTISAAAPVGIPVVGQLFPRQTGVASGGGALSNSRFANAILQREPLIYHRFGELAAAPTAVDEMGRVNGTYENVTKEVASLIVSDTEANTAISLNGVNSRITMGAPTVLQLQTFTILMLVKTPSDFSSHWRLFDYDSSDSWAFGRGIHWTIGTDGKHQLSIGNGGAYGGAASAAALAANTAYLLACSYDGATQKVYTNGAQTGSQAIAGPVSYANASLAAIGYVYFGGNLIRWGKGTYDEFAIFPYVMSDAGHLSLYKSAFNLP